MVADIGAKAGRTTYQSNILRRSHAVVPRGAWLGCVPLSYGYLGEGSMRSTLQGHGAARSCRQG